MSEKGKTYRFTVKLRKKPLQGGRFSLILDYYNGNVEYLSNEQRGERVREHLGLYLIPENSPEDKLANERTMELAREILEKKKAELDALKKDGLQPIVKKSKDEPIELPSSLAKSDIKPYRTLLYLVEPVREAILWKKRLWNLMRWLLLQIVAKW